VKRLTIRHKITLWYTILFVALLGIISPYIYISMNNVMNKDAESLIKIHIAQILSNIEVNNGRISPMQVGDLITDGQTYTTIFDNKNNIIVSNFKSIVNDPKPIYNKVRIIDSSDGKFMIYDKPISEQTKIIAYIRAYRSLKNISSTLNLLKMFMFISLPIYIIIAAIGGLFLAGRALKPIDRITKVAEEISKGDLTGRLNMPITNDEVGRLSKTFDMMLDRLEEAFNRERQFTSDASHELRTPVAVISAQAEEALAYNNSIEEYRDSMGVIIKKSKKMAQLISQLLMLTRSEEGKYKLNFEMVNISNLLIDVAEGMRNIADNTKINLILDIKPVIDIKADQTLITRMIINLIDNAIKYSKNEGKESRWIKLTLCDENRLIKIIVEDNGIGIANEDIKNIFKRFYRADKSRSTNGTGLGLSIVKWIVDIHNGKLLVQSTIGVGTKFEINFNKKTIED